MPAEGENLNELLSGFLDGELTGDELLAVQAKLDDAPTQARLDELSELRRDVKASFRKESPRISSRELASRVIEAAQREAVEAGLPDEHHVRLVDNAPIQTLSVGRSRTSRKRLATFGLAAAALILLMTQVPKFFDSGTGSNQPVAVEPGSGDPDSNPEDRPIVDGSSPFEDSSTGPVLAENDNNSSETQSPNGIGQEAIGGPTPTYVSGMNFEQAVVLVIDIEVSATAKGAERFDDVLRKHGLLRDEPVQAGDEIANAVSETRMMVRPEEDARASEASIYFVRSDFRVLGAALDELYFDKEAFPNVSFSIAVDNPMVRLMEKIARSTGQRFLANQSFAVPVREREGSPFGAFRTPPTYISAQKRSQGFSGDGMAKMFEQSGELNSVLFFVR